VKCNNTCHAISQDDEVLKLSVVLGRQVFESDWYSPRPDRIPHIVRLNRNVPTEAGDITLFPLVGKQDKPFWNVLSLLLKDPRARNHTVDRKERLEKNC
jgi:hypothetical protein